MTMTINNRRVGYRDVGEVNAPAIVMIHGFPFNKSMWNEQMEALRGDCRVVAYDVRGHGESDAGDEAFSIELFVQDLLELMDALNIRKAMLCGLSMGGYIALNAVINYPDRFNALVLSDTSCMAGHSRWNQATCCWKVEATENGIGPILPISSQGKSPTYARIVKGRNL